VDKFQNFAKELGNVAGINRPDQAQIMPTLKSIQSTVQNSAWAIRNVLKGADAKDAVGSPQQVSNSRKASRIIGTSEYYLANSNQTLVSISQILKQASVAKATGLLRDPKTGRFLPMPKSQSVVTTKPVAQSTGPLPRDVKTGRFLPRTTATTDIEAPPIVAPTTTRPASGVLDRMTNFMQSTRDVFENLPGVGAATSLMVLKATTAQTEELVKIRKILSGQYELDQKADVREEKAADQAEEKDFESRAGKAQIMPTFASLKKKAEEASGWFGGLVKTTFSGIVEGLMLRMGLKDFKFASILQKIPGVSSMMDKFGKMFAKIPGIGKMFGAGAEAAEVAKAGGVMAKLGGIGEWLSGLTNVFSKIPGVSKLVGLSKGALGKLAWPITVALAAFDFYKGWGNAGEILGKAEDKLTKMDRVGAGMGSILGGLVSILDAVTGLFGIKTDMGGFVKKWTAKLYATVYGAMFTPVIESFEKTGEAFAKLFGFRSLQSAVDFAQFKFDKGSKFLKEKASGLVTFGTTFLNKAIAMHKDAITSIVDGIKGFVTKTADFVFDVSKGVADTIKTNFVAIGDSVAQYLGFDSMKSAYEALQARVIGVFQSIGSGLAKMLGFDNVGQLAEQIQRVSDLMLSPFKFILDKVRGVVKGLSKVAGMLGYNDKDFAEYEKSLNTTRAAQSKPSGSIQAPTHASPVPTALGTGSAPATPVSSPAPKLMATKPVSATEPGSVSSPIQEGRGAEWVRPIMSSVTSNYGMRRHPVTGEATKMHEGTDYQGKMGDPIKAAGDGVVQLMSSLPGYGNVVYLNHANGYQTRYAHMSAFAPMSVGQHVKAGQVIGAVGNTGIGTGPHLHFEVRKGWSLANKDTKPENPEVFFNSQSEMQKDASNTPPPAVPVERPTMDGLRNKYAIPRGATGVSAMGESAVSQAPITPRPVPMPGKGGTQSGLQQYRPGQVPPEIAAMAVKMEKETGVPAAVTIAQWATESGWGKSAIGNNVFGMTKARRHTKSQIKTTNEDVTWEEFQKFKPQEKQTAVMQDGSPISGPWTGKKRIKMDREFADFDSMEEAFRDHARLLSSDKGPYKAAFDRYKTTGDEQAFIRDIAPTYASDRSYGKVIGRVAGQDSVKTAVSAARTNLGVSPAPLQVAETPAQGRNLQRAAAETDSLRRAQTQDRSGNANINVAPVSMSETNTTVVAELKSRNTENTHRRLLDREYYRT